MIFYVLFSNILYFFSRPFLKMKFKGREKRERLGRLKHKFSSSVWIHCASVGEVNAAKTLVLKLLQTHTKTNFVLSTMTQTGQEIAKKISPKLTTFFFPIDFQVVMKRVFNKLNPKLIILVETEFWPNMLNLARKKNIPVLVINGRFSDKSFPAYRRLRFFWKRPWRAIKAVNAQSEKDLKRFVGLKFPKVKNAHNLKFCLELPFYNKTKLRQELHYRADDVILVWGSSRPGEEKFLLENIEVLQKNISNLVLIIAPRHLHRIPQIKELFAERKIQLYSKSKQKADILIIDEMGILPMFYAMADIAIVGGSFFNFGGHNPLEPAFYGVPTIIGNYHSSCQDSVDRLLERKGIVVSDKKKLVEDILHITQNPDLAQDLGKNAIETLQQNAHSLQENIALIEKYL